VTLPVTAVSDLERYEGMLTTFTQALRIAEYFNFDRFNETVLATERQFQPTAIFEPGSPEAADLADLNIRSRITLDDGRTTQNPDPAIHQNGNVFDLTNLFRGGDTAQNATGVIDETFGVYRIQPTQGAIYESSNPRPAAPDAVGGQLKVASLNVLNYFTTLDEGDNVCGPLGHEADCRGADNQNEFERQRAKIIPALLGLDADVIGLMEIQNSGTDEAVADLVAGMNDAVGAGTYDYIATGFVGTDVIIQAFIYRVASVSPLGDFAVLDTPEFIRPNTPDPKNRPALAQSFTENSSGEAFTAVVNHLKSKGSGCGEGDDDPEQGSCNLTRTLAVQELVEWLDTDPTGSGDSDFLVIGDLNAYDKEDPIDVLTAAGYTDLEALFGGEYAYSYVFSAQLGYLDYALASESLLSKVTGATTWHTNADEPDILDYDTRFKKPAQQELYEKNEFRASDHDPVIVGLQLNRPPVCSGATPSIDTLWSPNHKMVDIEVWGVTDPDGDPVTITIDSIFQDEPVNNTGDGYTAPDAAGLGTSLAQLRAERDGGGNGRVYHINFSAADSFGNSCSGTVQVTVSVNRADEGAAVDDGPLYDSTIAEQ
jgi:predicted extracellular nuclease